MIPIKKIQAALSSENIDAVLISSYANILYSTQFTGFGMHEREVFLLITKKQQYLFTYGLFIEAAKKHIKGFTFVQITRENPFSQLLHDIIKKEPTAKIGYEATDLSVAEFETITSKLAKKIFTPTTFLTKLRLIKTAEEIKNIKNACQISSKAYAALLKNPRLTSLTEAQIATTIEYEMRMQGAQIAFDTVVAFGANTAIPHHVPTNKKMQKGETILIDFGARVNGYCADLSRNFSFGKPSAQAEAMYQILSESYTLVMEYIQKKLDKHEKIIAQDVDAVARNYIVNNGFPSYPHALGHGVGVQVHEFPHIAPHRPDELKDGMVFALEPGTYLVDQIGMRIEDIFMIQNNKLMQLSVAPKELLQLKI